MEHDRVESQPLELALAAEVDGRLVDTSHVLDRDAARAARDIARVAQQQENGIDPMAVRRTTRRPRT